jgi:hypothetical protein
VDSQAQAVAVGLPPGSRRGGPWREGDTEHSMPEPAGAIGIVGRKLDQWLGHGQLLALVQLSRGTDERFEGLLVDVVSLLEVYGAPLFALEAGVEQSGWILQ